MAKKQQPPTQQQRDSSAEEPMTSGGEGELEELDVDQLRTGGIEAAQTAGGLSTELLSTARARLEAVAGARAEAAAAGVSATQIVTE